MKRQKHGKSNTRLYRIWRNMKSRCHCSTASKYYLYGGKGIDVYQEWSENFMNFYQWAIQNGYQENLTIDRIDSNKDYCPDNCRWATYKEQNSHLNYNGNNPFNSVIIEYNGIKLSLTEWAEKIGVNPKTLRARYERGWSVQRMLETPTIKKLKRGKDGRWVQS